jgi:hypothetical protein
LHRNSDLIWLLLMLFLKKLHGERSDIFLSMWLQAIHARRRGHCWLSRSHAHRLNEIQPSLS